ncbi:MAG: aminotransferase class I/II-fold pyridoxal phosphate-dependent enzyme [Steroidobacteraceae bacterium]
MQRKSSPGLSAQMKEDLIQRGLETRVRSARDAAGAAVRRNAPDAAASDRYCRFDLHPGYQQLRIIADGAAQLGIASPFFKAHEGIAGARTRIAGREYLNFSSYNYLGLNGHPAVAAAAKAAIDRYGTSVSASRAVSGERPVHRELEQALARVYGTDAAVVLVSGHATNVTTIGCLFGARDLVLHDELIHNSTLQGIQLAGAHRVSFPHNDWGALDELLARQRRDYERVLIVLEGIYSMDGDYPDLPRFIEVKRRHRAFLMVDEAHSFGVMGPGGLGVREHFAVAGTDVDIWMGTLSKALAGCGGYIAGTTALIEHLKFLAPGFLYSVGMAPPLAAASLAALELLLEHPERARVLRARGALFLELARAAGIDTGTSAGISVIPAIVGSSIRAARVSEGLYTRGINVQPVFYPAVPEKQARLRFFMSCEHSESDIRTAVAALAAELLDQNGADRASDATHAH